MQSTQIVAVLTKTFTAGITARATHEIQVDASPNRNLS